MKKFRKRPLVIEAIQFTETNHEEVMAALLADDAPAVYAKDGKGGDKRQAIVILTREGEMYAHPGDYIIKGIKGGFYPCKPDIFEATYEVVE